MARDRFQILYCFGVFRRQPAQDCEVDCVDRNQHHTVGNGQRTLPGHHTHIQKRREQSYDFDCVMMMELDRAQRWITSAAVEKRRGHVNHRPAETGQQPQSPSEVRQQELDLLVPCQDRLHRELRERLQPRQNRQRESLRDKILRGFRGPGDHYGGDQNRGSGPQNSPRAGLADGGFGEQE